MAINFNINDIIRVNTAYVQNTLPAIVGKGAAILQTLGYLGVGPAIITNISYLTPLIVITVKSLSNESLFYYSDQDINLIFSDDIQANNSLELSPAFLSPTISTTCLNSSGGSINKYQIVTFAGYDITQLPKIILAGPSDTAYGIANEDIPNGGTGNIINQGSIDGLDTTSFAVGGKVFIGITPGSISNSGTNLIGIAINSSNPGAIIFGLLNTNGGGTNFQTITLPAQGSPPSTPPASSGTLFTEVVSGVTQFFYIADDGNSYQLTPPGGGSVHNLQDAYNGGNTINIFPFTPVQITSPVGSTTSGLHVRQNESTRPSASFVGPAPTSNPLVGSGEQWGFQSTATGGIGSAAFGRNAQATAGFATALGSGAAFGLGPLAAGTNSVAISTNATTYGDASIAIGLHAASGGAAAASATSRHIAIGFNAAAATTVTVPFTAANCTAIGPGALAGVGTSSHEDDIAIGTNAIAGPLVLPSSASARHIAIGSNANAGDNGQNPSFDNIAIGSQSAAKASSACISIGSTALCFGDSNNIAIGSGSQVGTGTTELYGIAIGMGAFIQGANDATAIGRSANVTADFGIAIGQGTAVIHANSIGIGVGAATTDINQIMWGPNQTSVVQFGTNVPPAVSPAGAIAYYYDTGTNQVMISINGAPYIIWI